MTDLSQLTVNVAQWKMFVNQLEIPFLVNCDEFVFVASVICLFRHPIEILSI